MDALNKLTHELTLRKDDPKATMNQQLRAGFFAVTLVCMRKYLEAGRVQEYLACFPRRSVSFAELMRCYGSGVESVPARKRALAAYKILIKEALVLARV